MRHLLPALLLVLSTLHALPVSAQAASAYAQYPTYEGSDLGLTYANGRARIRVWAPTAQGLTLRLYATGTGGQPTAEHAMKKSKGGTWTFELPPAATGFYTVQATIDGRPMAEVVDPYAHAVGLNGQRGALLDPSTIHPPGWEQDIRPPLAPADVVIGELHVRDLTMHPQAGSRYPGQYLGVAESGTRGPQGVSTGLDHLAGLGITHVHLLPVNDFASVDESQPRERHYNWGYDPLHYSVPEGSYSSNAADPAARIRELKQVAQALHAKGLRLVLDVVYNHTSGASHHPFDQLVPGYYYRQSPDGRYSDAAACGNEVASERPMVRKLIVESLEYWARHYHVDGFRFDLMGILDLETMRTIRTTLDAHDRSIFLYGEGWTARTSPLPAGQRALKANVGQLDRIAAFGDELRDGVRGHVARHNEPGFASGHPGLEESIRFGIVGATRHPQIDYGKVNYSSAPWAATPSQCINYVGCHDDLLLWDKLQRAAPGLPEAEHVRMDLLSAAIVFTSQGVPFLPVGDEFLRTKGGASNSYNQPDSINQIDWTRKARYGKVYDFYRRLIALRRAHPAFRLPTASLIQQHLEFLPGAQANVIAYRLRGHAGGDAWQNIVVVFNGNRDQISVTLPTGTYQAVLRGGEINEQGLDTVNIAENAPLLVPATSALILVQ